MRYLITWEVREPVEENNKKALEIENERRKKGEIWADEFVLSTHFILSEPRGLQVVDTDESKLAKWKAAYYPVYKIKISPIMSREKFEDAKK